MKKVLIWGTGKVAKELLEYGLNAEIIGMIESYKKSEECNGYPVYDGGSLSEDYDYIIIANMHTIEIFNFIKEREMDMNKIVFYKFCPYYNPKKNIQTIREILGEKPFQVYCNEYKLIEESSFNADKELYTSMNTRPGFAVDEKCIWPVIGDKFKKAGSVNNYFWQDLWAARLILKERPKIHYDIGSRLDGFIAHLLSAGIPVKMIDIRPFPTKIDGLETIVDDATALNQFEDNSIESLSALCSLEHFGLGRYGDTINPEACFICFEAIKRKVKPEGHVYISVPVGRERVEFNAHRVFYAQTIIDCFSGMELKELAFAAHGELEMGSNIHRYDADTHDGEYRYGLFHFVKKMEGFAGMAYGAGL